jgi:hypothetical protein
MAVTQPQDHDHTQGGQPAYTTQQMPTMEPMGQLQTQQEEFLGIRTALKRQGHLNCKPATVASELSLQRDIQGNTAKQTTFKDFATNIQMRVYLTMVGEQKMVTMIHTIGVFYSIRASMNTYQGKILGFIGDRRATKEPTPVCLPQTVG